jgi:hypothetical protein
MIRRLLLTPFGLASLACLVFAGWAVWSGGLFDGPVAATVRSSSVYAAPGTGLDTAAAQKIIGNRRLVVIMMRPGAKLDDTCHAVRRAARGTLVLLFSRDGEDYDHYGCSQLPDPHGKNFGKQFVAETTIADGIDQFVDDPLGAVKVMVVNYDQLAKSAIIPSDARTISPSLPRYLAAAAAIAAVVLGAALLYAGAFRTARMAAARRIRRDRATDERTILSAATAVVAQQIIDLDARFSSAATAQAKRNKATNAKPGVSAGLTKQSRRGKLGTKLALANARSRAARLAEDDPFLTRYRQLSADYLDLVDDIAEADRQHGADVAPLTRRAETLAADLRALAG